MNNDHELATRYRNYALELCALNYQPKGIRVPDNEFHQYLYNNYQDLKAKGALEGSDLFILGAGLVAYGHLETTEDVLNNIPLGRGHVRRMAGVITSLMPTPHVSVLTDTHIIKEWFAKNREN